MEPTPRGSRRSLEDTWVTGQWPVHRGPRDAGCCRLVYKTQVRRFDGPARSLRRQRLSVQSRDRHRPRPTFGSPIGRDTRRQFHTRLLATTRRRTYGVTIRTRPEGWSCYRSGDHRKSRAGSPKRIPACCRSRPFRHPVLDERRTVGIKCTRRANLDSAVSPRTAYEVQFVRHGALKDIRPSPQA